MAWKRPIILEASEASPREWLIQMPQPCLKLCDLQLQHRTPTVPQDSTTAASHPHCAPSSASHQRRNCHHSLRQPASRMPRRAPVPLPAAAEHGQPPQALAQRPHRRLRVAAAPSTPWKHPEHSTVAGDMPPCCHTRLQCNFLGRRTRCSRDPHSRAPTCSLATGLGLGRGSCLGGTCRMHARCHSHMRPTN
jgi:hypothetical protein